MSLLKIKFLWNNKMIQKIKDNPFKSTAAILTSLAVIIGGFFMFEDRYAKSYQIVEIFRMMDIKQASFQITQLEFQKSQYEDKIFDLELECSISEMSAINRAKNARYKRSIEMLEKKIDRLTK